MKALAGIAILCDAHQAAATPVATTTTLAVTSSSSVVTTVTSGTVVTLTATVLAGTAPITVGQVNFCNAAATHCTGGNLLATAQLTCQTGVEFFKLPGPASAATVTAQSFWARLMARQRMQAALPVRRR